MTNYDICVNLIPNLPQEPYNGGVGKYLGVIMHSTAVYDDTPLAERNYEAGHYNQAFVHYFVDHQTILQVASTDYVAFGAGQTANHDGYIHNELCQSTDVQKFAQAYDRWTWLAAKLLHDKKLGVVDGVTLWSHKQVSDKWKETDHTDPIDYLASHGKQWADVVADVTAKYNDMDVVPVSNPTFEQLADKDIGYHGFDADVKWAYDNGIIGHYSDNTIRRQSPINREQFAYAIHQLVKKLAVGQIKP